MKSTVWMIQLCAKSTVLCKKWFSFLNSPSPSRTHVQQMFVLHVSRPATQLEKASLGAPFVTLSNSAGHWNLQYRCYWQACGATMESASEAFVEPPPQPRLLCNLHTMLGVSIERTWHAEQWKPTYWFIPQVARSSRILTYRELGSTVRVELSMSALMECY